MLLGFSDTSSYDSAIIELKKNQTLFLYSDGFIELSPKEQNNAQFELTNLIDYFKNSITTKIPLDSAVQNLISLLKNYHGSDEFDDDMMLLAISRR